VGPGGSRQLGSLDSTLHARVNGEIYRFATPATMARFVKDPVRWCGILRDPVSGSVFMPDRTAPRIDWADGPYFFTCDSTRLAFCRNPASSSSSANTDSSGTGDERP
jgi:YHS domain-containing protein